MEQYKKSKSQRIFYLSFGVHLVFHFPFVLEYIWQPSWFGSYTLRAWNSHWNCKECMHTNSRWTFVTKLFPTRMFTPAWQILTCLTLFTMPEDPEKPKTPCIICMTHSKTVFYLPQTIDNNPTKEKCFIFS